MGGRNYGRFKERKFKKPSGRRLRKQNGFWEHRGPIDVNTHEFKGSESSCLWVVCGSVCAGKPIHHLDLMFMTLNREEIMISPNVGHVFREKVLSNT